MSEPVMEKCGFPIFRHVFNKEYCDMRARDFEEGRMAPKLKSLDELVETWCQLRQATKERMLFLHYARALIEFDDENKANMAADLFWILRECFVEETDKRKLLLHFNGLLQLNVDGDLGMEWLRQIGAYACVESYLISDSFAEAQTIWCVFFLFMRSSSTFLHTVRLIWIHLLMATDARRLIRKMGVCRLRLQPQITLRILQFEIGVINDRYLNQFKDVYQSSWQGVLLGLPKKCSFCNCFGYTLWCCGLCVQEGIKKKARYCNFTCQAKDWKKHGRLHKSDFDEETFNAEQEEHKTIICKYLA